MRNGDPDAVHLSIDTAFLSPDLKRNRGSRLQHVRYVHKCLHLVVVAQMKTATAASNM